MRVLIQDMPGRHAGVVRGWASAFRHLGHEVAVWGRGVPAFDAFGDSRPQLFVRTGPESPAIRKCVAARPTLLVSDQTAFTPAFDSFRFAPGRFREELACDACYVGSYREEKRALLDAHLLPLCGRFRVKIFGEGPWPVPNHLGTIADADLADLYASAGVVLNFSLGRLSERAYQAVGLGASCLSMHEPFIPGRLGRCIGRVGRDFYPGFIAERVSRRRKSGFWGGDEPGRGAGAIADHTYIVRAGSILRGVGLTPEKELVRCLRG
jgi:hypothetical protein